MHRRLFPLASLVLLILLIPGKAISAWKISGVHIVSIQSISESQYHVKEFIDFGVLGEDGSNETIVHPALGGGGSVEYLSASVEPLLVFYAGAVDGLEQSIISHAREIDAISMKNEVNRQVLGGLFQIPIWPYLAASEIPLKAADVSRFHQLQYEMDEHFPATNFATVGNFEGYRVEKANGNSVTLLKVDSSGEGLGLVLDYTFTAVESASEIQIHPGAKIGVVYSDSGDVWLPAAAGSNFAGAGTVKLLGYLDEESTFDIDSPIHSSTVIQESGRILSRQIIVSGPGVPIPILRPSEGEWAEPKSGMKAPFPTQIAAIGILVIFAAALVVLNLMFRFSEHGISQLFLRGVAIYPVYLLGSLLLSGFSGMGFIPTAAGLSRFISNPGKRLAGTSAILGASFVISAAVYLALV